MLAAGLLAGLAFAVDVRYGVYAATVTDASAYVAAGDLWRTGELFRPVPLHLWGQWPGADQSLSPLGFRPALVHGAEVAEYALGFPILIAAATALFGASAAYLVAPAAHAVLVWSTFAVARRIGGEVAGGIAAALMAANPIALLHGIHPMSDVPATACWIAAWAIGLRSGVGAKVSSGLLATLAVMIRPVLVPLVAVLALAWLWRDVPVRRWRSWQWRDAIVFAVAGAVGAILVAWSQWQFYGGVATPGYLGASAFFRVDYAWPNIRTYPALFGLVYGWLPLLGMSAIAATLVRTEVIGRPGSRPLVWTGVAMAAVNALAYLFYLPYDAEPFLRFFQVALTVAFILYGVVVAAGVDRLWPRRGVRWLAPVLVVAALWPSLRRPDLIGYVVQDRLTQMRVQLMGHYLEAALPADATMLGFIHTGAVSHYTRSNVVRLDLVPPDRFDGVVDALERGGAAPVFVIDEQLEEPQFRERFKGTRYGALDWPPRGVRHHGAHPLLGGRGSRALPGRRALAHGRPALSSRTASRRMRP